MPSFMEIRLLAQNLLTVVKHEGTRGYDTINLLSLQRKDIRLNKKSLIGRYSKLLKSLPLYLNAVCALRAVWAPQIRRTAG
jgi:hypothetical protein